MHIDRILIITHRLLLPNLNAYTLTSLCTEISSMLSKDDISHGIIEYLNYDYVSANHLQQILLSTIIIQECNLYSDIIDIIISYIDINYNIGWSLIQKSPRFNASEHSSSEFINTNTVDSILLPPNDKNEFFNNTIFCNSWIPIDSNKKLFRYYFNIEIKK